ncbi:FTR1 family protein [Exiguobacterium sp. SL14]|nr:FTR1 family protein [Exiguobacterium sp. SL14]MCY1689705.1 FTR1 family protein [Exiguobacterium sp. SL14]
MIIHSFLVIVREGIETVFFFAAISGGEIEKVLTSYGAVSGLLLALIFGYLFVSGSMKIPVKRFFQVTGVLILFIGAGMLVQTIGRFQDLGLLGSLLMNADGTPVAVYNIVSFMPEHYIDQVQYLRDTGNSTLISGQIGTFMGAMFGYSHNPSLEQVVAWWGYFAFAGWMLLRQNKPSKSSKSLQEVS